jgi:2-polyprenyl-3-methyl-5-hydroxy-6-metoxy-1,4-benzoquinol methylase
MEQAAQAGQVNIPGNHYDKYNSKNAVARWLMAGFLRRFDELVAMTGADRALEAGCGEGHLSLRMARAGMNVRGIDLEPDAIARARTNAAASAPTVPFEVQSLYDLSPATDSAPLIVSCEVLEHVPDPDGALEVLTALARPWLLVSTPNEPLWRVLNMARGSYLADFGNTPGHIQHWSSGGLKRLLQRHARVEAVRTPLPWTMLLCRCD